MRRAEVKRKMRKTYWNLHQRKKRGVKGIRNPNTCLWRLAAACGGIKSKTYDVTSKSTPAALYSLCKRES